MSKCHSGQVQFWQQLPALQQDSCLISFLELIKFHLIPIVYKDLLSCFFFSAIAQEKTEQELRSGIEGFDAAKLKHAETQEKNPLPDPSVNTGTVDQYHMLLTYVSIVLLW